MEIRIPMPESVPLLPPGEEEMFAEKEKEQEEIYIPKKKKRGSGFFAAALLPALLVCAFGVYLLASCTHASKTSFTLSHEPSEKATLPHNAYLEGDELRGAFVASAFNIDFPSALTLGADELRAELDKIVQKAKENSLNTLFFQVSPYSDALWASSILPSSYLFTGTEGQTPPGGLDALSYLCEAAGKEGIAVYAWVNPMRITSGVLPESALAKTNPAVMHPEWTVRYDGQLYYDLGCPEARGLYARVCAEIVSGYDVRGIIFDDYFYPYPKEGQSFDDSASYEKYGDGRSLEDYRRASSTALVKECRDAIKAVRADALMGVAPFGIWRNDDGQNGGSQTLGFESYSGVFCDTLGMAKEGALDFIAPQIYWEKGNEHADFDTVCSWWSQALEDLDVKYCVSLAATNADTWGAGELVRQVEFARGMDNYAGCIFYSLGAIEREVTKCFSEKAE